MSKLHLHALMVLILFMGVDLSAQKELLMVEDRSFRHPGLYQNQEDLAHMRKMIKDQIEPFFSAFKRLSEQADLDFDPQPVSHVVRGSYGRGSIGGDEFRASARASYQHALMWELTGDKTYANKAIEIINAWTPVIWDFDGNDAKVIIGWAIHEFCNAAELLRYSDSGWEADDIASFEKTLLTIYYPVIEHFFPEANGNWDGAIINSMMSIGVFCDRKDIYNRAVSHYLRGPVNGGFTRYFYPNGQCQENTRDQIHTQMGLDYFAKACQIAWTQGSDLYELANNRLALAFEFTSKYMAGHEVNAYGTISEKARDRYRDNFHAPFYHYTRVKGLSMPYTSISVDSTLAKSTVEFLSAIRAPIETVNPVSEEPQPYPMVGFRGAKFESTTNPPSDAIRVRPGDSIQAAIDLASINGKWVVLEEGVHHISSSRHLENKPLRNYPAGSIRAIQTSLHHQTSR